MNQKELIDQAIENAKLKLNRHRELGDSSPYTIFDVASMMDDLHFNQNNKGKSSPILISKN